MDLGGNYFVYTGYFWPLICQGQSQVIQYISEFFDFRQFCISETISRRAKRSKVWASGVSI